MAEDPREPPDVQSQLDALRESVAANRSDIDMLQYEVELDHKLITELQADGLVRQEHVDHLTVALRTSRKIGAAIGIIMAERKVTEEQAFEALSRASQNTNRKLRDVAEEVILTGTLSDAT